MKAAVIIVAAGASRRFGAKTPKQFMPLKGKPLFLWSVRAFKKVPAIKQVILVVPENKLRSLTPFAQQYGFQLTAGGKERIDSVKAGLALLHPSIECVAVHDGAVRWSHRNSSSSCSLPQYAAERPYRQCR